MTFTDKQEFLNKQEEITMRRLMVKFFDIMSLYITVDDKKPNDPKYDEAVADLKGKYLAFT